MTHLETVCDAKVIQAFLGMLHISIGENVLGQRDPAQDIPELGVSKNQRAVVKRPLDGLVPMVDVNVIARCLQPTGP